MTALVAALGAVASLIPAALVSVAEMGVVIAELSLVLAAVGALAQIPGLSWLISEGGNLLQTIGEAVGGFIGGIVGGFMTGVSSSFPQIATDLSAFMTNIQPFIDGASKISPDILSGIGNLTGAILLITAADLLEGLTSWLTGGSSLADFGNELVPFGESMVRFSDSISGLDANLVDKAATAAKTLAEMAATLPNSGGVVGFFAGENDMDVFGEQLVVFGGAMMDFAKSVSGLDAGAVQNASTAGKAMAEMAATLPNSGGVVGFFAGENDMDAFGEQLVPFGKAIKEYSVAVMGLDADAVINSATAGAALVELANTVPNTGGAVAFFTGDNDLATFGDQIVEFGKAMKKYSKSVSGLDGDAVANSASAGAALVELANTIPNTGGLVSFFTGDNDLETFGEQLIPFGEGMKTYSDSLAGYEKLQTMYAEGSEERKKIDREVYRIQNELVTSTYQASLNWIETEKYYNRLSTQAELEAYERMQKRYIEGSEERIAIDKKVYELRNQLVDESYQNSMDWIEEEKYYNRLSLADELAAYKRVQSRYEQGTEERKKLDREVYSLEQEIYEAQQQYIADVQSAQESANERRIELEEEYADKVKSINEQLESDIESAWKSYENSIESRANSLYRSYGLFDAVSEKDEISGETLMQNLEDQVQEFGEWQDILSSLSAKDLDEELIEELQEMGPSSIAQIKALNNMSDSELEKYVSLWSIKHAQAREQATSELEGLRDETLSATDQLRADADTELSEYQTTWQTRMDQITADCNEELEQLRKDFGEKVGLIKTDTETEMQEMADAAQAILTAAGWDETGQQIVTGLTEGVEENKAAFLGAITQMALEAVEAVEETLDINSPSKVFRELGNFTSLGFVTGIADYAARSYDAGCAVGESAKDGLSEAMQTVSDCVNGDMEIQPTIRPVLDLTNIMQNAGTLNSMFDSSRILALAGETSLAFSAAAGNSQMQITIDNDGVVQELHSLRGEITEMVGRMERMQIYLDTGALVGAMADPIDNALGQKNIYKRRGI